MENKFTINSVQDYIVWITSDAKISIEEGPEGKKVSFEHDQLYFRGQANKEWPVIASVFRDAFNNDISEYELLKTANLKLSNHLSIFQSYLDKLIYLQHYGLKTRLIDVTFNPLIALYFACATCEDKESDGVVYSGFHTDYENHQIAELIAEFVFSYPNYNIEDRIISFSEEKNIPIHYFQKPIFLFPPISNPRLEHQNGAFIMSPLIKSTSDNHFIAFRESIEGYSFFHKEAIIPKEKKNSLLKELNTLGINKGSIYQDVADKIDSIVQEEKWKLEKSDNIIF